MDSAEEAAFKPIYEEANKRGYKTKFSKDVFAKCEIGFYCQHNNFPQNSKFSLIMLHDIIQQYGNWPDLWIREPWDKYDIGILPGKQWVNNWNKCSQWHYANPRIGMFQIGWPKADAICKIKGDYYRKSFNLKHELNDERKTILYAPAWENDNKQVSFVESMKKLDVNILIKQWDADPQKFPNQVSEVKRMQEKYKEDARVVMLPPSSNIFEAIAASDILVSEESSTMCEAVMLGVPSVSVSDWLIPDVTPHRFPKCNYDFVEVTKSNELEDCIRKILDQYQTYKQKTEVYAKDNFGNIGKTSQIIMDIIDDVIENVPIRYDPLTPNKGKAQSFSKEFWHIRHRVYIQFELNYLKRRTLIGVIWGKIRPLIIKET